VLLLRVRLDIEDLGVAGHWGCTEAGFPQEGRAARAAAARRHIGEIGAELPPACRHEIGTDEGQQALPSSGIARTELGVTSAALCVRRPGS
jgi:hypothetical protein